MVNGGLMKVSPERLKELRRSWSPTSGEVASGSRASRPDIEWTLDFIASVEAENTAGPCLALDLQELRHRDLTPIKGHTPEGQPLAFAPKSYSEWWVVAACGHTRVWQVFDEAGDARNPHRVILGRPASAKAP